MEPEDEEVLEQNEAVGVVGEGGPHVVAGQSPLLRITPLIATGALNLGEKLNIYYCKSNYLCNHFSFPVCPQIGDIDV